MTTEEQRTQLIVKLQRLSAQTRNAIDYLQRGGAIMPCCNPTIRAPNTSDPLYSPNTFEVGDFVITQRFTTPH